MSSFGGTKTLVIVIGSNKYFTSGVIGCFVVLYVTAGLLLFGIAALASIIAYHRVEVRENLNQINLAMGSQNKLRINSAKNNA